MALVTGARLGAYEITGSLGAGGMGEVYRAKDLKLGREVAIKTLPTALASDNQRLARFEREARLLAALNHAHIASVYNLDEHEGMRYLAMELVEGETLEEKLKKGPLPLEDSLHLALQIAEALEAAHEKGVVHRDLKPANIMVTDDGRVKVLDFGLAKAFSGDLNQATPADSPASSLTTTQQGHILGTAGYMSPEQAGGQATDQRSDVWSFGVVLYEMLTGLPLFVGDSALHVLAAVLQTEPNWNHLPKDLHPRLKLLLEHCLAKKPRSRLHSIADARIEIEDVLNDPHGGRSDASNGPRGRLSARSMIGWTAAVAVGVLLGAAGVERLGGRPAPAPTPTRLSITAPGQVTPQTSVAVSPDGREIAFVSTDASGQSRLWVRDLDALAPRALAGTEDAAHPFWAPDGSAIGFVARGQLKRVDAAGGQVLTLADGASRNGGAWSPMGVVLFVPRQGGLATVPATGGPVSTVLTEQSPLSWPSFLPDGRHFIIFRFGPDVSGVYVGSLGSQTMKLILPGDFQAAFAPPDYLLFARDEGLVFAQHFDLERLELTGEPTAVAEGVWSFRPAARVSVSASGGVLAYVNASLANAELAWFDRTGRPLGTVGEPGQYQGQSPSIAPDGTRLAIAHGSAGGEVWVTRLSDGTAKRLTLEPGASRPIWSHDSRRILFLSTRGAFDSDLFVRDAGGNGAAESVGTIVGNMLWDWSPDGQRVVFGKFAEQAANLWILPIGTGGDAVPFAPSRFNETQAAISPDGRWIAYTSYESGRDEVYIDSFPTAGNRRQISVAGGVQPRWRRDGGELFYLAPDQLLMAVPVTTAQGHFDVGRATPLFRTRIVPQGSQVVSLGTMYDASPDGQRFLLNEPPADSGPPITVVLNWAPGSTRSK